MMKPAITILGGEFLSSLGAKDERLAHLYHGTYHTIMKTTKLNGELLSFPYYAIGENDFLMNINSLLGCLQDVVSSAIENAGLQQIDLSRCGLFLGCSSNDFSLAIPLGYNYDHSVEVNQPCRRIGNGVYADFLQRKFGLSPLNFTYNTACTSSANALMDAASMLEGESIDYALVVGIELFTPITFEGFASMHLLSPDAIRPFDKNRNGIAQGEAISALFLSRSDICDASWSYLGGISNCETYSVTGTNPDGTGIGQVIRQALQRSRVFEEEIVAIKTHGTASELNDTAEINGMKRAFKHVPPFFSLKSYIGHTLGACGSTELLLVMESMDAGFIPSSANFNEMDEELGLEPLRQPLQREYGKIMLNYFGFGGNNTSFIVEKRPQ